tara:strand:- start:523 stop:687 length:165 start_codon:yes stop_codon:yes gene_type:complete
MLMHPTPLLRPLAGSGVIHYPKAAPNLHLAQVLHSLGWVLLKDGDARDAATIES